MPEIWSESGEEVERRAQQEKQPAAPGESRSCWRNLAMAFLSEPVIAVSNRNRRNMNAARVHPLTRRSSQSMLSAHRRGQFPVPGKSTLPHRAKWQTQTVRAVPVGKCPAVSESTNHNRMRSMRWRRDEDCSTANLAALEGRIGPAPVWTATVFANFPPSGAHRDGFQHRWNAAGSPQSRHDACARPRQHAHALSATRQQTVMPKSSGANSRMTAT